MNPQRIHIRILSTALVVTALSLALLPNAALAKLEIETRLAGRTGSGGLGVGDVLRYDVFVSASGGNARRDDDGIVSLSGSFLSNNINGGIVRGNISVAAVAPFDNLGSFGGLAQDLDGDGDLDAGGTYDGTDSDGDDWFAARVGFVKFHADDRPEFKIAEVTFAVTSLVEHPVPGADTLISFAPRWDGYGGLWRTDNALRTWEQRLGVGLTPFKPPVVLGLGEVAVPDPDGVYYPPASLGALVPEPSSAILLFAIGIVLARPRRA